MTDIKPIDPASISVEVEDEHGLINDIRIVSDRAKGVYLLFDYTAAGKRAGIDDYIDGSREDALMLEIAQDSARTMYPGKGKGVAMVRVLGLTDYSLYLRQDCRYGAYVHIMPPECGPRAKGRDRSRVLYRATRRAIPDAEEDDQADVPGVRK